MDEPAHKKRKVLAGENAGWMKASSKGAQYSCRMLRGANIKVSASRFYDLRKHFEAKGHEEAVSTMKRYKEINEQFLQSKTIHSCNGVRKAEILFSHFVAKHYLPAAEADHLTELMK